ncbi:MAG: MarR family transcriptional regulator [Gammaproteobacteria bacterium]|nr:MarR family transcriptional regulator [Gammaproteobacteria bacterium]
MLAEGEVAVMFKAIRRIVRAIDVRSREVARAVGLTIPQIVVLQAAQALGAVTTKALSERADLSSATVITILDKLEEKGLVERYRSTTDRRIVHTRVTERGARVLADAPPLLHDEFNRALMALPAGERGGLIEAITRIADMMDSRNLDAAPILTTEVTPRS